MQPFSTFNLKNRFFLPFLCDVIFLVLIHVCFSFFKHKHIFHIFILFFWFIEFIWSSEYFFFYIFINSFFFFCLVSDECRLRFNWWFENFVLLSTFHKSTRNKLWTFAFILFQCIYGILFFFFCLWFYSTKKKTQGYLIYDFLVTVRYHKTLGVTSTYVHHIALFLLPFLGMKYDFLCGLGTFYLLFELTTPFLNQR